MMHRLMMGRGVEIKDTNPKKLTFDEWSDTMRSEVEYVDFCYHGHVWYLLEKAWNASRENL